MDNQRRPGSFRATSPDQPKAKAQSKANANGRSKEQRDHHRTDSEDKSPGHAEDKCTSKRGSRKQKSEKECKKKTDCESEGKPRKTAKSKCDEKPAPKHRTKKERDPPSTDKDESPQNSQRNMEAKARRQHESESKSDARDASPAVCAHSTGRGKKSADTRVQEPLGKVLKATIEKLKIKKKEQSYASSCVNDITDQVIGYLERNTTWCKEIESLRTGSYYENVKICEPDEFDVMLTIPVERVDIQEFDNAGAFYSIALKRHPKSPLDKFLNEDKTIRASEMLNEFRDAVKKAVEKLPYQIKIQRKKAKCPAVTLEIKSAMSTISVDFVLGLKVHRASWPDFTKDGFKIENWLGKKERTSMRNQPFYLVPKYEGVGSMEHDGIVAKDTWRISFSHVEKEILKKHGHSKTCCEDSGTKCCRKECLKLLKYLLHQLKGDVTKSNKMSSFCSYYAKTTLLHACAERGTDDKWAYSQLAECFQQLLEDFVEHLRKRHLPNFFIPSHNLLHQVSQSSCNFLADEIEFQRNNNFPIFK